VDKLLPHRLLTIIGPGGIGKTSVALAVAEALLATYDHGIRPTELSPLADPRLVSTVPAATLDTWCQPCRLQHSTSKSALTMRFPAWSSPPTLEIPRRQNGRNVDWNSRFPSAGGRLERAQR
jgi:hypothetical protein